MPTNQTMALPPFNDLQKALFNAFTDGLPDNVGVFDNVPENRVEPWVTIGESSAIPDNWHGGFGWSISSSFHVWTKSYGYKPGLDIANQLIGIIDHRLTSLELPDNWTIVAIRFTGLQTMRDPDPQIRHVPVQFQVVVHQQEV